MRRVLALLFLAVSIGPVHAQSEQAPTYTLTLPLPTIIIMQRALAQVSGPGWSWEVATPIIAEINRQVIEQQKPKEPDPAPKSNAPQ